MAKKWTFESIPAKFNIFLKSNLNFIRIKMKMEKKALQTL